MELYLNNVQIDPYNILGLSKEVSRFNGNFCLGKTACCHLTVKLAKTQPIEEEFITVVDGESRVYRIDGIDDEDDNFNEITLIDPMLDCARFTLLDLNLGESPISTYLSSGLSYLSNYGWSSFTYSGATHLLTMPLSWNLDMSFRDFLGYMAEVNWGEVGFEGNELVFKPYTPNAPIAQEIRAEDCSSLKIAGGATIGRVVYDNGDVHYEQGEGNQTLYLNTENPLFTDSQIMDSEGNITSTFSIEQMLTTIANGVIGFSYYNIEIDKAPVMDVNKPSSTGFDNPWVYIQVPLTWETEGGVEDSNGRHYLTLPDIEWDFNGDWIGGIDCDLQTPEEQESVVTQAMRTTKKIITLVDRARNEFSREIQDLNDGLDARISRLIQTSETIQSLITKTGIEELQGEDGSLYQQLVKLSTELAQTAEGLKLTITKEYYENDKQNIVDDAYNKTMEALDNFIKTFEFTDQGLIIRQSNSNSYTRYDNDGIYEYVNGNLIATFTVYGTDSPMYIVNGDWTIEAESEYLSIGRRTF